MSKDLLLKLKMIAENADFNREIRQSNKELDSFRSNAKSAGAALGNQARSVADVDSQLTKHNSTLKKSSVEVENLGNQYSIAASVARALPVAAAGAAAAFAAGAAVAVSYGRELVAVNRELTYLSASLNISKDALQVWGIASKRVGFGVEEIAGIFKDFNEKAGDFAATGGGEAKEIFERLNIDIKEFIGLPADQKLLSVAEAFDKLGDEIGIEEKTFLLEAMGNDASRLLPLLENNAEQLREIERISRQSGAILDADQIAILDEANEKLNLIGLSAKGLRNEVGTIGAEFITALGDDAASAIQYVTSLIDYAEFQAKTLGAEIAESWVFGGAQIKVAAGDAFSSVTQIAGDASETGSMLAGFMFESIVDGYTYLPVISGAAYAAAVANAESWLHENDAAYNAFKGATAETFAALLDYANPAFSGLANIGGQAISFIIARLADLLAGIAAVSSQLSAIPGFENITAGVSAVESKLRGMAAEAANSGAAVSDSMAGAADGLRAYAKEAELTAARQKLLASEAKLTAVEALNSADAFIELSKAKRQDAALKYEESLNKQAAALAENKSALDRVAESTGNARINQEAINNALGRAEEAAKKATVAKVKLTDAEKEAAKAEEARLKEIEAANKARLREAAQLEKAQQDELKQLDLEQKQLKLNEVAFYAASLAAKDFSQSIIDQAEAIKYSNILLEEKQKLAEELSNIQLDPVQQYEQGLLDRGLSNDDAQALADEKRKIIYEQISSELENQLDLLGKSWEETRRIELANKGLLQTDIDRVIIQEKQIQLKQKEIAAIDAIKEGLQSAIQSAINGDGFDFGAIADGIQKSFTDRVFTAAFEADFANADSLSGLLQGFQGNAIGQNIAGYAGQFGIQGFQGAGQYQNWQYGAAGTAGGYAGEALFGSGGDIGGQIGATIGMAVAGPVGAAVGTVLGGLAGSIFGGEYEQTGAGVRLAYSGGEFAGNQYIDSEKDGGLLGSDKSKREYDSLSGGLNETLDNYFDAVEASLVNQADALYDLGIGAGGDAAQAIIDGFGGGADEAVQIAANLADAGVGGAAFSGMFLGLISEVSGLAEEAIREAQASFDELDLTGLSEQEAQQKINEWAEGVQEELYHAVFAADYEAMVALAQSGETASQAIDRLIKQYATFAEANEYLGGSFDATGTAALEATNAIVQLFGGMEQFTSAADFFYQNYFTEEERKNQLLKTAREETNSLNAELEALGYEGIETRQDLRGLIAGLDETSEEGQRAYYVALQLAASFDILADAEEEAARAAEDAAKEAAKLAEEQARATKEQQKAIASLKSEISGLAGELFGTVYDPADQIAAINDQIRAEQDRISEVNKSIAERYADELAYYDKMQDLAAGISDYLDSLQLSSLSVLTPLEKLQESAEQYQKTLAAARAGDAEAAGNLTGSASAYLENARGYFASSDDYTAIFDAVQAQLSGVELNLSSIQAPNESADIESLLIPQLERQIEAIERQTEFLAQQDLANELQDKLQELSLATGQDIATLSAELGLNIDELGRIISGDSAPASPVQTQTQTASTLQQTNVVYNAFYDLNKDGRMSLAEQLAMRNNQGKLYNSYAVGSDYVRGDQTANIHDSEMIFSAQQSGSIRDSVVSALKGLSVVADMAKTDQPGGGVISSIDRLIAENRQIRETLLTILDSMNDNADVSESQKQNIITALTDIRSNTDRPVLMRGAA